ncbi:hypothetical protein Sango_3094400 [Sesamum angolense]|uniref:DUF4283 domain-containing protein n=1 Tax=Sesamum angolense TaxID=2727404 RepID=A0AAE1T9E3_9LAMI|nr:hypothetical protein Sango_3094400 [Sesamum angolense]
MGSRDGRWRLQPRLRVLSAGDLSPTLSALHTNPTPLTATSIDGGEGFRKFHAQVPNHPPFFAGPTENDRHSPADEYLLRLNGALHHRSSGGSPPQTSVQPAERAPSLPSNRVEIQQQAAPAPLAAPLCRSQTPTVIFPAIAGAPANPQPELFFGNIPLNPHLAYKMRIKSPRLLTIHSSRKTLNFIPPSVQNGEVIVRPSIDMIRAGSKRWNTTAVGYFLGKKPYFHHLNEFVRSIWPEVPVWIKLRHLPVELWTTEGLSTVASGIGRPLYPDAITRACTRLDFARVCVMLNVSSKLPKHVVIMLPNELGGESACKVDVEYEWLPPKCKQCVSLGHSTATCPESNKIEKPKVAVYVQKRPVQPPTTVSKPMAKDAASTVQYTVPEEDGTVGMEIGTDERSYIDKGKAPSGTLEDEQARPSGGSEGACKRIQTHNTLLLRLEKCCKLVFFKATKLEQVMLQQRAKIQWLKEGDQCSRIFFRKVAMRRASKRVFQIKNEDGHTLTTQEDVVNEFVSFYQRLLGVTDGDNSLT